MAKKGRFTKADYARAKRELGYKGKLTRKQAQRVFKRAIKIGKGKKTKPLKVTKTKITQGKKKMAKKKKRGRRKFTIPLAPTIGVISGLIKPLKLASEGHYETAFQWAKYHYTGFDMHDKFYFDGLIKGWGPIVVGGIMHWVAGKLGINRMLGRAGVPIIRV